MNADPNSFGARADRGFFGGGDPGDCDTPDGYYEPCSYCGGEGDCMDGADPLGDCRDEPHECHACSGSGRAEDQVIW